MNATITTRINPIGRDDRRTALLTLTPAQRTAVAAGRAYVGQPASIVYVMDSRAAVVTRVTATTAVVALVEVGPAAPNEMFDRGAYGLAVTDAPGLTDKPIAGTEQRFTWSERKGGYYRSGLRLVLGRSVERRDWRD